MYRWTFAFATLVTFLLSIASGTTGLAANRFTRAIMLSGGSNAFASTYSAVHVFTNRIYGAYPNGKLLKDAAGALYGTTAVGGLSGYGTVFKLTPPPPGKTAWTETILHSFSATPHGGDGCSPLAGLVAYGGDLYGTTYGCGPGGFGTVFRLSPPAAGRTGWKLTVLHAFADSPDGANPEAPLVAYDGALYSTTFFGGSFRNDCNGDGCGTVFRLVPPAAGKTAWTESVIHSFNKRDGANPSAALIVDASGALYSTTLFGGSGGDGNVFRLRPPAAGQASWKLTELYAFADKTAGPKFPQSPLLAFHGALYGTTTAGGKNTTGTIYKLSPPAANQTLWNESTLYSFGTAPSDGGYPEGLSVDAKGYFYGTTQEGGTNGFGIVFKLTPPASGSTAWREQITHEFNGANGANGATGSLLEYSLGTFLGTSGGNGPIFGTVYEIKM